MRTARSAIQNIRTTAHSSKKVLVCLREAQMWLWWVGAKRQKGYGEFARSANKVMVNWRGASKRIDRVGRSLIIRHWKRNGAIPRAWTRSLRRTFHQRNSWVHEFEKILKILTELFSMNRGPPQAPPGFVNWKDWIKKYRCPPQAPAHFSGEFWMNFSKSWPLWWNSFKTPWSKDNFS